MLGQSGEDVAMGKGGKHKRKSGRHTFAAWAVLCTSKLVADLQQVQGATLHKAVCAHPPVTVISSEVQQLYVLGPGGAEVRIFGDATHIHEFACVRITDTGTPAFAPQFSYLTCIPPPSFVLNLHTPGLRDTGAKFNTSLSSCLIVVLSIQTRCGNQCCVWMHASSSACQECGEQSMSHECVTKHGIVKTKFDST
jgi:hypothetical protein